MKKLGKRFGSEQTKLELSDRAYEVYCGYSPLDIFERETEEGLVYFLRGCVEADDLTADELDEMLVELGEPDPMDEEQGNA